MSQYIFTSESVTEGHPDKVCDYISDSILDACLEQDPQSRVACETLCKDNHVILAGEVKSSAKIDHEAIVRTAIRDIGYVDPADSFHADGVHIQNLISRQSPQIGQGVDTGGAGDQGLMFGYATDETPELMPLPILLAHRLSSGLAKDRKSGAVGWLRPDGKTQVSVQYENERPTGITAVVVSTQHAKTISQDAIREYVVNQLLPRELGQWHHKDLIQLWVNPTGEFSIGGPTADCGVTGRKIIVDTYGGFARHGGGAFSGKDPSKVDRSAAYFARAIARQIVTQGLAKRAEIQVSYAIGVARPISIKVDTFGTGDAKAAELFARKYDYRPQAIIEQLDLLRPIYRQTTNYGHFGKAGLPWEEPDRHFKMKLSKDERIRRHKQFLNANWLLLAAFAWEHHLTDGRGTVVVMEEDFVHAAPPQYAEVRLRYVPENRQSKFLGEKELGWIKTYDADARVVVLVVRDPECGTSSGYLIGGTPKPSEAYAKEKAKKNN